MTRRQLRAWRLARQWSQSQAAAHFGYSLRQWQRFEAGKVPPRLARIILAEAANA